MSLLNGAELYKSLISQNQQVSDIACSGIMAVAALYVAIESYKQFK